MIGAGCWATGLIGVQLESCWPSVIQPVLAGSELVPGGAWGGFLSSVVSLQAGWGGIDRKSNKAVKKIWKGQTVDRALGIPGSGFETWLILTTCHNGSPGSTGKCRGCMASWDLSKGAYP